MGLFPKRMFRGRAPSPLPPKPNKESDFKKPVAWLLGRQLIASLKGVILLAIYGGKLDPRDWMRPNTFSVRGTGEQDVVESSDPADSPATGEFWFDYISDSGDGQLATYGIAYLCLSDLWASGPQPALDKPIEIAQRRNHYLLPRGSFLLVGGDTAYHMADYQTLARRFWNPFRWAAIDKGLNEDSKRRPIFGVPGNHDYYDAVDGFNRQFRRPTSEEGKPNAAGKKPQLSIPGFERRQTATYLAVRMPFDWYLWAVDSEVEHVDIRQQEFFKALADEWKVKKLIVATSEPTTVLGQQSSADNKKTATAFKRLGLPQRFFLKELPTSAGREKYDLRPGTCRVDLSGDTHHYARYWGPPDGKTTANYTSVVAGMGGAFMHPSQTDTGGIKAIVKYPSPKRSREVVTKELLRVVNILNGGFIWLIGAVIAGLITFAAIRVPSTRAAVDSLLGQLPGITAERLAQPSGIVHRQPVRVVPATGEQDPDRIANLESFLQSFLLWCAFLIAGVLMYFAAKYPKRLSEKARDDMVESTDYWPVWVLTIAAVAAIGFGFWMWGRDHSAARVLSDLVFISLVVAVIGGAVNAAASTGAELLGAPGKILFALLGLWHGVLQLTMAFLMVRMGNVYSIIVIPAIILAVAAGLGILCSKLFSEVERGMDSRFGLALLSIWVASTLPILASVLWLDGAAPRIPLNPDSRFLAVAIPVAAAAVVGAAMSCINLGWYLAVAVAFNGHNNEAGGAARIGDFKQMIRFRINEHGLTGFVIAFDRPRMNGADLELKLIDVFTITP